MLLDISRPSLGNFLAEVHDHDAIDQSHDEVHIVLYQKDSHALGAQPPDKVRQCFLLLQTETCCRLIEQQKAGIGRQ